MTKCRLDEVSFDTTTGQGLTIQRPTAAGRLSFKGACLPSLRLLNGTTRRSRERRSTTARANGHPSTSRKEWSQQCHRIIVALPTSGGR
jgi:hypothetical protein